MNKEFSPKYEAQLREHFAGDFADTYLIASLRVVLDPKTYGGIQMARGIMAIYDEMKEGKS